jgi:hypothetical protein
MHFKKRMFMETFFLKTSKRAALTVTALFFFLGSFSMAFAEIKLKKAETSKDIIEKAYNLSLQKDRPQATNILVGAIKQENTNGTNTAELKKALQQVTYLFYSDRAQQSYELAVSLKKTDLPQAQQKLSEALRMEPDNLTLFIELQRILLIKKDCSGVLESVLKEREQNPFDENLPLLQGQAQACLGHWEAVAKIRDQADGKHSSLAKYWQSLEIEQSVTEKNLGKAKDLVAALQKTDAKYPEVYYWQWKTAPIATKSTAAQKYLKECKNISPMTYRQYMTDVNLCRKNTEIEATMKTGE